jgi:hypothetical protein
MRAEYHYTTNTYADIASDIQAILTGETDKNNLSATCDKTNTFIISTVAAGWQIHDASAGTNTFVVKAPHIDAPTNYKYAIIDLSQNPYIKLHACESWDEIGHTPTNKTVNGSTSEYQRINTAGAGIIHIFASERFIALVGEYTGVWGGTEAGTVSLVVEYSRGAPWNPTTYPSFAFIKTATGYSGNLAVYPIKGKTRAGVEVTGTNAQAYFTTIGVSYNNIRTDAYFPTGVDAAIEGNTPYFPIFLYRPVNYAIPLGQISTICDIWMAPMGLLTNKATDTNSDNSNEYVAIMTYNSTYDGHFLFRNG